MDESANDLELLDRVLLKFGLCDDDEQFQQQLNKFLSPVLLKIVSPREDVRRKVMEILTHVNKRLKSRSNVKINLHPIMKNYEESSNSFLINFAIIYITIGFPRLSIEEQLELAPVLLNSIENKPEPHQNKIVMLIVPLLALDNENSKNMMKAMKIEKPMARQILLSILMDVLLLPYGHSSESEPPPAMSKYGIKRVELSDSSSEYLENVKKGIVRFLRNSCFEDHEFFVHLVIASADTRFSVATDGLNELNRIIPTLDWSDPKIADSLYTLFTGNFSKNPDKKTSPCTPRLKTKILQYLVKFRGKALNVAKGLQVIFEGLFGASTNQKCKTASLQFASTLIFYSDKELIQKLVPVLQTHITKLISSDSNEPNEVQNGAYQVISKLITKCPENYAGDVKLITEYYNFLASADADLHNSIKDCLIALANAFKCTSDADFNPSANHLLLQAILNDQSESKLTIVQTINVTFLTTCFPGHYMPARYLLLYIGGTCIQLKDTIHGHLYGSQKLDNIDYSKLLNLPSFTTVIDHVYGIIERKMTTMHVDVMHEVLFYTRICLWQSAGYKCKPGAENNMQQLSDYVEQVGGDFIERFVRMIRNMLQRKGFTELTCLSLCELLMATPNLIIKGNLDLQPMILNALKEVNENVRKMVAKIYGIFIAYSCNDLKNFKNEILQLSNMSIKTLEHQHGSLIAIANAIFYRIIFYKQNKLDAEKMEFLKSSEFIGMVNQFVKLLSEQKSLLLSAAIEGISLFSVHFKLPFEDLNKEKSDEQMEVDDEFSKEYVLSTIVQLLKSTQTRQKIREESALCLGYLAIGDHEFFAKRTLTHFLDLKRITKDAAIHIAIAQGLSLITSGDKNLPKEVDQSSTNDDQLLDWLLTELIKIVPEINVCSRQAISLWLLAIVQSCSNRVPVLNKRMTLQMAFTHLLSEDNELVQDVASRGLGLIFNMSSEEEQSQLSTQLLDQLTEGNKGKVRKVDEDTQLFEEGVLGKTPTGQNMTTYKELCSIASDLNHPEILYSFMQLANHNASWNSRLGAAFGLQSISAVAKEKLQPYLENIVPRLYRYKYDPTPKIQNSMIAIWDAIIINSKETVEEFYWQILAEVIKNLTHPEWRTRIACCLAIRDLIRRPNGLNVKGDGEIETELRDLWLQLFRVMDDFHEGTREAAGGTAKVLSKLCAAAVSCDHGKRESFLICNTILPILLEPGCTHTIPEIRAISLMTISEIIDSSGDLIQPHLVILIPSLLKATGETEQQKLSMLSTMMSGQSESQEIVDSMRAEVAKNHYTIKTITKCIKYIDGDVFEKSTPAVLDLIKSSVNLGTKIACAHYISLVITSGVISKDDLAKFSGKYITAALTGLADRNFIIRKYYANAIGDLIGIAKTTTVASLFKKFNKLYFDDQLGNSKSIAQSLTAINTKHHDMLRDNAQSILPLMLFAKHEDTGEETMWKDLWSDVNFGDSLIAAHISDITALLESSLNHQSWLLKAQSGRTIEYLAKRLNNELKGEAKSHLIELLLTSISGRTFNGKEHLVEAAIALCQPNEAYNEKIINAVLRECRKEEKIYKTKVIKCLGNVLEKLDNENRFEDVYEIVWTLLEQSLNQQEEDASMEERNKEKIAIINLKEAACECLGKAWPTTKAANSIETQKKYQLTIMRKLTDCLKLNTRSIQKSLLVALSAFIQKSYLLQEKEVNDDENLRKICELVMANVAEVSADSHTGLKKEALEAFLILIKKLKTNNKSTEIEILKTEFGKIIENFQKDSSPEIKLRLKDISEILK
ncbi:hypothetical protein PVAND_015007 [Polypedilum vanderplanki]|uniref:Proteasome-associated protein ECM29-like protein n=1 Tax=Polypedilum vanderplanki TaxID=319348 RepID=A0A9J6BAZ6_POLVA|nr:hypothetical protein PVAND_015007 [Polypedilum vanderplanki]